MRSSVVAGENGIRYCLFVWRYSWATVTGLVLC